MVLQNAFPETPSTPAATYSITQVRNLPCPVSVYEDKQTPDRREAQSLPLT
jgi:hypothetical protein